MKKLLYLTGAALLACGVAACEDEAENPGDFNLAAELELDDSIYSTQGQNFKVVIDSVVDSVYRYSYTVNDTLRDNAGEFIFDEDGNLQITTDTLYYNSIRKAKVYHVHPIELKYQADTFYLDINSNAKWLASVPSDAAKATQWFFNYNSTTAGGGDSRFQFRVSRNLSSSPRKYGVHQQILTSDSTIMYILEFTQAGRTK